MAFSPELTPSQHVARREALAQVERVHATARRFDTVAEVVTQRIFAKFAGLNRLDATAFERTVSDIRAAVAGLRAKGITFKVYEGFGQDADGIWSPPGGGAQVAWFADPDGNVLSLTQFG